MRERVDKEISEKSTLIFRASYDDIVFFGR
jgi:hypothetical protein